MTTLRERLDEYLELRRSLGFQLNDLERQVGLFCTWLEARGQTETFTTDDAVAWARLNPDAHPSWWATRLSLVRRFAAYLNANDVDVPVIPSRLLPARKPRAVPFIYSQQDIDAMLAAEDSVIAGEMGDDYISKNILPFTQLSRPVALSKAKMRCLPPATPSSPTSGSPDPTHRHRSARRHRPADQRSTEPASP